jgi:uncharacterized membrane protein (DUF106 family)
MSNENSSSSSSGGIGFAGLLTIVFITLKLLGVIHWSWLWVLSPLWISLALTIAICVVVFATAFLYYFVKDKKELKQWQKRQQEFLR